MPVMWNSFEGSFMFPCRNKVVPDPNFRFLGHAAGDQRCHHLAPRSRRANISSHVGSIHIGLPQIRIDDGPRSVGVKVS